MLKVENITIEVVEKAEKLGYVVASEKYENEGSAEKDGFYWVDEIDRWVNIEKINELL